jgi:peptide/nickel transport system substrate-binding protein
LRSNPYRLVPPFGDAALEPLCGGPWRVWVDTDGESGEEPPEDVLLLFELVPQWKSAEKGSDEYIETGQEIIEIIRDNFFHIGFVSDPKRITVIHNTLHNVPTITYQAWDLYRTYPFRAPQWFIKE